MLNQYKAKFINTREEVEVEEIKVYNVIQGSMMIPFNEGLDRVGHQLSVIKFMLVIKDKDWRRRNIIIMYVIYKEKRIKLIMDGVLL